MIHIFTTMFSNSDLRHKLPYICIGLWFIWLSRNESCFKNVKIDPTDCARRVSKMITNLSIIETKAHLGKNIRMKKNILITWRPPMIGWVKLNCDGTSLGNPGAAGAGCVLRDNNGKILFAMACPIPNATCNKAEFLAAFYGLKVLASYRLSNIIVEVDSQVLHRAITSNFVDLNWELCDILNDIR
ncbi:reverse transcriptase [Thalictrum thalictroides]|uniref:Reverse transcriptase n=1 Tax=Thalictrum thalictroides TaxID=46969 RepID=A0A7J6UQR6_THATH|nr:reverse transcriptase [Thalictrum thalictroides]